MTDAGGLAGKTCALAAGAGGSGDGAGPAATAAPTRKPTQVYERETIVASLYDYLRRSCANVMASADHAASLRPTSLLNSDRETEG
jgi:hypothetical protein